VEDDDIKDEQENFEPVFYKEMPGDIDL